MSILNSALSFKNIFNEKIIKQNLSLENKGIERNEDIESLIEKLDLFLNNLKINKNTNIKNSTFFSNLTKSIDQKLNIISCDILDKFAFKLYNKLTEISKEFFNHLKTNNDLSKNEIFKFNFVNLNLSLSNFYKVFQKNFQNYNEVHKNIIKNTPNFLKVFFKLFEENINNILSQINHNYNDTDLIKSCLAFIATLMNTQTNMLRPHEIKLENMLNKIMICIIKCNNLNKIDKSFVDLTTSLYGYSINLNNDINKKFPILLDKYFNSLNFYLNSIEPVSIKNKKNIVVNVTNDNNKNLIKNNNKENDFHFLFDEISYEIMKSCIKIRNCIFFIFKLIKNLLFSIGTNQILEINLKRLIGFLIKNIFYNFSNLSTNEYIISGLNSLDYNLVISYLRFLSLKLLKKIIINFNPYLNTFIPLFKDVIRKFTIFKIESTSNFENCENIFEMKIEILKFIQVLIDKFDLKVLNFSREYISKLAVEEFCDLLICFLEKNDKTIVKIDKCYFKLGDISNINMKPKNNKTNKKGNINISLLDIAKQETYNAKLDIYNIQELQILLTNYLKSKFFLKLNFNF